MSTTEMNPPPSSAPQDNPREPARTPLVTMPSVSRERDSSADKSLDMVRNILFGEQVREIERKQATLERFVRVSVNALAEDTQKKFDAVHHEINLLKDQLAAEAQSRREDVDGVRLRLAQHERFTDEQVKKAQAGRDELHARVGREVERLEQRVVDWRAELLEQLHLTAEQLRHEKADRKAVAGILNGMARQLFDGEAGGAG